MTGRLTESKVLYGRLIHHQNSAHARRQAYLLNRASEMPINKIDASDDILCLPSTAEHIAVPNERPSKGRLSGANQNRLLSVLC